jgi:hypothetical protein
LVRCSPCDDLCFQGMLIAPEKGPASQQDHHHDKRGVSKYSRSTHARHYTVHRSEQC